MADRKKLQATIFATVEEIVARGSGPGYDQAKRVADLADYLARGDEPMDLYSELTGSKAADESFLRTIAAERAENQGWDLDELLSWTLLFIRLAGSIVGLDGTAKAVADLVTKVTAPGEVNEGNPNGLSALELLAS